MGLRQTILGAYGPLSVLLLIVFWEILLIVGFGLIHYGLHTRFREAGGADEPSRQPRLLQRLDLLHAGLRRPHPGGSPGAGARRPAEAGLGFGMLAAVMGYLPVLYGAFASRESAVMRLANRCGSEIDGVALVVRYARTGNHEGLASALDDLEGWLSELMESTASYPMLALYRSPRNDRSWVGAITAVLDATTLLQLQAETPWPPRLVDQAELTYSMAHRTLRAINHALRQSTDAENRRPHDLAALQGRLARSGIVLSDGNEARWEELTRRYEPDAVCLAEFLCLGLPAWPTPGG